MWIERITIYGYGPISSTVIDLGNSQVNVLAEKTESLKELLMNAIWSTLFGFPQAVAGTPDYKLQFQPPDEAVPYRVSLDLTIGGRKLRITRDFSKRAMQVLDRETKENVTSSFRGEDGSDKVGPLITGVTSETFRHLFVPGEQSQPSPENGLQTILECLVIKASAGTSDNSPVLSSLDGAIFKDTAADGPPVPLHRAIIELTERRTQIVESIASMDNERLNAQEVLKEIKELDRFLNKDSDNSAMAVELNNLRMESIEVGQRLEYATKRFEDKKSLDAKVQEYEMRVPSGSQVIPRVRNLWMRRESRRDDAVKLSADIEPKETECARLNNELHTRYDRIDQFTVDEGNAISGLAINFYKLQQELNNLQKNLQEETGKHMIRMQASSDRRGPALQALQKLRPSEFEQVKIDVSLLALFKARLADEKKKIVNAKLASDDIRERRLAKRHRNTVTGIVLSVMFVLSVIPMFAIKIFEKNVEDGLAMGIVGVSAFAAVTFLALSCAVWIRWARPNYFLRGEAREAFKEIRRHEIALSQAQEKITKLDTRVTAIAVKAGVGDIEDFIKYVSEGASHEVLLQEYQSREATVETEEQRYNKIRKDLAYYFEKAGIDSTVLDSQTAMELSQHILRYHKDSQDHETQFEELRNAKRQLDFLNKEVSDIDREIKSQLKVIGTEVGSGESELDNTIKELISADDEKQNLLEQLGKIEYDLAGFGNVTVAIRQMENEKREIEAKITELIKRDSSLADMDAPNADTASGTLLPWGNEASQSEEAENIAKRDGLVVRLRESLHKYDGQYLEAVERLAEVEFQLDVCKKADKAIGIAKEHLRGIVGQQSVGSPLKELNDRAGALVKEYSSEIESLVFSSDFTVSATFTDGTKVSDVRGSWPELPARQKEQLALLLKILVAKSMDVPLILAEPAADLDQDTLRAMTELLISTSVHDKQIIMPSCHYQRYQELKTSLEQALQPRLTFRARKKVAIQTKTNLPAAKNI